MAVKGIIVLEGADCTGKTTLAKALVEQYDGVYIHNRYHKDIWPFFMASMRWAVRESKRRLVIIDRHWASECVYARVYRKGTTIGPVLRGIQRVLAFHGALNVVCAPHPSEVVKNHKRVKETRKEMYDDVSNIALRYHELWRGGAWEHLGNINADFVEQLSVKGVKGHYNWEHYDFTQHSTPQTFKDAQNRIMQRLMEVQDDTYLYPFHGKCRYGNVAGNPDTAKIIFVCSQRADYPFCSPRGRYNRRFNQAVHNLWLDERFITMVAWTGSLYLSEIGPDQIVVALGHRAADACDQAMVDCTIIHSPGSFLFGGDYARKIKRAIAPVWNDEHLSLGGSCVA